MKIRDRIKGLALLDPVRIRPNPKNWRTHPAEQRDVLRGVLADVGVVDAVLVRPVEPEALEALRSVPRGGTDVFAAWLVGYEGDFILVDGHLRVEELQQHGQIDALVLDLDEREAAEVLATFDPIGDLAGMDRDLFLELAEDFNSTNAAVQALVADLAKVEVHMRESAAELDADSDDAEEEEAAPDQSAQAQVGYVVLVDCDNEQHQLEIIESLMAQGLKCRALT